MLGHTPKLGETLECPENPQFPPADIGWLPEPAGTPESLTIVPYDISFFVFVSDYACKMARQKRPTVYFACSDARIRAANDNMSDLSRLWLKLVPFYLFLNTTWAPRPSRNWPDR